MGQMYPLPTHERTVEVNDASFLKWCIYAIKLVSIKNILFRHWDGNPGLSFFNFTFGIDEIWLFMKPTQ